MLRQVQSDRSNLAHGWLPFAADSIAAVWHSDAARGPSTPSFDHLVGEREQLGRNVEAERLGGNDTDDQLVLGWHLDGQVAWLRALEDARHVVRAGAAIGSAVARAVAHQAADHDKLANIGNRRHAMTRRQCGELPAAVAKKSAASDKQCAGARLNDRRKGNIDFAWR